MDRMKYFTYHKPRNTVMAGFSTGMTKSPLPLACSCKSDLPLLLILPDANLSRYFFSILLQKISSAIGIPWVSDCDTTSLRVTNVLSLVFGPPCLYSVATRLSHAHMKHEVRSDFSLFQIMPYIQPSTPHCFRCSSFFQAFTTPISRQRLWSWERICIT